MSFAPWMAMTSFEDAGNPTWSSAGRGTIDCSVMTVGIDCSAREARITWMVDLVPIPVSGVRVAIQRSPVRAAGPWVAHVPKEARGRPKLSRLAKGAGAWRLGVSATSFDLQNALLLRGLRLSLLQSQLARGTLQRAVSQSMCPAEPPPQDGAASVQAGPVLAVVLGLRFF